MGTEYTPMDIYRYLIPDLRLKLARFQSVKNKASSKRLHHIYGPHYQDAPHRHLFSHPLRTSALRCKQQVCITHLT